MKRATNEAPPGTRRSRTPTPIRTGNRGSTAPSPAEGETARRRATMEKKGPGSSSGSRRGQ
eukprot:3862881-Heterocapsa_arctica.AAC.1